MIRKFCVGVATIFLLLTLGPLGCSQSRDMMEVENHPFIRQSITLTAYDICHVLEIDGMNYLYCRTSSGHCSVVVMPGSGYYDLLKEAAE